MQPCSQEDKINKMDEKIDQLKKSLYGNGESRGVYGTTEQLALDMAEVKADLKCLVLFQTQEETRAETNGRHKKEMVEIHKENRITQRWLIGTIIFAILTLLYQTII